MAAAHRNALLEKLAADSAHGIAVLPTGGERTRSRDTHYKFRPDSDFWYLTAFPEPDAVLVLAPGREAGQVILFVRPRDEKLEIWNGRRAGVDGAQETFGADEAHPIEELDQRLPELLKGADRLYYRTGQDAVLDQKLLGMTQDINTRSRDGVTAPTTLVDPSSILHEMRLIKSADELDVMRRAAAITETAHRAAMKQLQSGMHEWSIEALVDATFREHGGWGPGYTTICASGANACVLHYITNDHVVRDGDCLLIDAGCEVDGYTADVTRTFPSNGRFTPAQRELYEVVLAAQLAGCAQAVPGNTFLSVHEVTTRKLVEGMIAVGLLTGSVDENLERDDYKRFYMHRTSHWLGLDVHDVGTYFEAGTNGAAKPSRVLEPGMVLTVEPGLYVAEDCTEAPERFRGIGIRIEDDLVITADGHENLTGSIPKTIDEVEAAC
jgi:Xaa-Pro aminopeptidase